MRQKSVKAAHETQHVEACPECGADIPIYPRYSPWCEQCNWNLQPMKARRPRTPWGRFQARLGKHSDEHLFKTVNPNSLVPPRITITRAVSLLLATLIHAITIVIFYYGINAIIYNGLEGFQLARVVLLTFIAGWAGYPRFDSVPPNMVLTESADFPAVNELVERVATALNVPKPLIMMTEQFTATFGRVGHRRQPVLCLGHPFLSILDKKELVSLVAHELSHSRDGALTRSTYVRVALTTLDRWTMLFSTKRFTRIENDMVRWALFPITLVLYIISAPILSLTFLLEVCCYRDSQLAEYIADAQSLPVGGTQHAVSLLKKSYYRHLEALRIAYDSAPTVYKYSNLKGQLDAIPERELERVWRIAQRQQITLRSTHPSLGHRVAFLQSSEAHLAKVTVDDMLFAELHRELEAWPQVIKDREKALHMSLADSNYEAAQDALFVAAD
ncbi:MAG: M48 family metallopeptidase [Candidatus Promineifilaceae bacterium]